MTQFQMHLKNFFKIILEYLLKLYSIQQKIDHEKTEPFFILVTSSNETLID